MTQHAAAATPQPADRRVTERKAWAAHGVPVLVVGIGLLLGAVALLAQGIAQGSGTGPTAVIVVGVLLLVAGALAVQGLTSVVAGEARAVQLFGRYRGTIRTPACNGSIHSPEG